MDKRYKRERRHRRVRKKIFGTMKRPRLSVFRSNKYIYAQLIDDVKGVTIMASKMVKVLKNENKYEKYQKEISGLKGKVRDAYVVGRDLGERARKAKVKMVVFDRGGYKFTGRVAALAKGARDAGLLF